MIKSELEKLLKEIPGYDPWEQSEGCWLDHDAAAQHINWFAENLKFVGGKHHGRPFILRRWQAAIIGNIFGWKRKDQTGRTIRRYRKVFITMGKGNGKTPLAAGIVLACLFLDNERAAEILLAAGSKDQAGLLFRHARGMCEQNPKLFRSVRIYGGDSGVSPRSIVLRHDPLSAVRVIPADVSGQHGSIPHVVVIDELHVQQNCDLVDLMESSQVKATRSQPLLIMLTNVDYDRPSICNEMHDYARRVRDNHGDKTKAGYDPEFLPVIYELAENDDWHDESVWIKSNPNLGVSVSLDDLRKLHTKACEQPRFESAFRRLNLNQKTKLTVQIVPMESWRKCTEQIDPDQLAGKICFAGMDLSSTEDLSSYALVFPIENEKIAVISRTFCPEEKIRQRARQRIPYDIWHRQGYLIATAGDQIDYQAILEQFANDKEKFSIVECGVDPWGATHLEQILTEKYGEDFVVRVPQTLANLSPAMKHILRLVKLQKLLHGNNPVLTWAASNVSAYFRGKIPDGSKLDEHLDRIPVMPSKRNSADKIDPFTALVIAVARLMVHPESTISSDIWIASV